MLAINRTSASPAVVTAREEACCPIPHKLAEVKKTGLMMAPITISKSTAGRRLASRTSDKARAWRLIC